MSKEVQTIKKEKISTHCAVSFDEFKKALGDAVVNYTDTEIERIRIIFDSMADQFFNTWIKQINNGIIVSKDQAKQ